MTATIQLKRSSTAGNVPASMLAGEIDINLADRVLYRRDPAAAIAKSRFDETLLSNGSVAASAGLVLQLPAAFNLFHFSWKRGISSKATYDNFYCRVSANAGSTFTTTGYSIAGSLHYTGTSNISAYGGADTGLYTGLLTAAATNAWTFGEAWIERGGLGNTTGLSSENWGYTDSYLTQYSRNTGWIGTASVNAIKFFGSTGNISLDYAFSGVAV